MLSWLSDVRFAVRMLRKSPLFTVVAILIIALGAGAVTSIFSALNALVLRPLPGAQRSERVAGVELERTPTNRQMTGPRALIGELRTRARLVEGVAGWNRNSVVVSRGSEGVAANATTVTGNYFSVLRVTPALGRFFLPNEDSTYLTHPVAVVSHAFWTNHLASDPRIVGSTLQVNGTAFTVIGVAPPDFLGAMPIVPTELYIPTMMEDALSPLRTPRREVWLRPIARLRDGVSFEAAQRELSAIVAQAAASPSALPSYREFNGVRLSMLRAVPEDARGGFLGFISLLLGAAVLVMLIASVNVASMLSARAIARRREMALRTALGAARGRLVRQLLTESVVLFTLGAGGGLMIAYWSTSALEGMRLPFDRSPVLEISPDYRALAFALGLALVTGLVFGLAPALRASRLDISTQLRDDNAGAGVRRSRLGSVVISAQLAASLVLLVCAGLFIRAVNRGEGSDPGFDPVGVSSVSLNPESWGYDKARSMEFFRSLQQQAKAIPGVTGASYSGFIPMSVSGTGANIVIAGLNDSPVGDAPAGEPVRLMQVGDGYFDVMRVPILRGRPLVTSDNGPAPRVVVVNETLVRRFWPKGDAIGRTFQFHDSTFTVVGVARDAKYDSIDEVIPPVVYFSIEQEELTARVLLVRSVQEPNAVSVALQRAVLSTNPGLPRPTVTTVERANRVGMLPQRIAATATTLFGSVGLFLAAVGLYGIISYVVARRTREIGVRVALGAPRAHVVSMIVNEGFRLTVPGVAIGLALATGVTRLLSKFLFGVSPLDLATFAVMSALLIAVGALASYLPARRAANTSPLTALRAE